MTLQELQKDMIAAMKAQDKVRKNVISNLIAAVKKYGIDNGVRNDITEEMTDSVILKEFCSSLSSLDVKTKVVEAANEGKCFFLILVGNGCKYRSVVLKVHSRRLKCFIERTV